MSLRAGQRAPAAAAAADTAFLRRSYCTVCMSAHSTVRKALRRSCTISRFLEKLHELRFASPTLLPRLLYSTVMYHTHRPRIYCVSNRTYTIGIRWVSRLLRLRQRSVRVYSGVCGCLHLFSLLVVVRIPTVQCKGLTGCVSKELSQPLDN